MLRMQRMQRMLRTVAHSLILLLLMSIGCERTIVKEDPKSLAGTNANSSKPSTETGDRSKPLGASEPNASTEGAAKALLGSCIASYKKLQSYEDRGTLRVRFSADTKMIERSEPMRMAFESPNRLAIQVGALQAIGSDTTWEAIVRDEEISPYGSQRLVRPLPESIDLTWLIVDNLGYALNRTETDAPMPLQMLFDEDPLAHILGPTAKLSMLSPALFDAISCERVQVITGDQTWVFWIDPNSKMLRKYDLPIERLGLAADIDRTKIEWSVELLDIKANASVNWASWQVPRKKDDILVRRFIDAPPRNQPALLHKTLPQFDLRDAEGRAILDSAQRSKKISILCWVSEDEVSKVFVANLETLQQEMDRRSITSAEIILISKSSPSEMKSAMQRWNCKIPLAVDGDNLTQKLFQIPQAPAVMVLDKLTRVQFVDLSGDVRMVPDIVEELQRGKDFAAHVLQVALDDEARFASRLHRAVIEKEQVDQLPPLSPYIFTYHETKAAWNVAFEDRIVAASGEPFFPRTGAEDLSINLFSGDSKRQRVMTVLDELGHVHSVDNKGTRNWVGSIPIDQAENPKRLHVLPDPWFHRWVAIVPEGLPRYWLIDVPSDPESEAVNATQFDLDEGESSVACAWTSLGDSPRLMIASNKDRLRVLNPQTQEIVGAKTEPVAAIAPTLNSKGEFMAWNLIGLDGAITELTTRTEGVNDPRIVKLPFLPEPGAWTWGRNRDPNGRDSGVLLGMARLPSGEAGSILQSQLFEPMLRHPLSVRPEQCRLLASTTIENGSFYWLATAPNRVLHLQTVNGYVADSMSLGKRIVGAGLFPRGNDLQIVIAVDNEVNCWSLEVPKPRAP